MTATGAAAAPEVRRARSRSPRRSVRKHRPCPASPPTVPPMAYRRTGLAGWRKLAASIDDLVLSALKAINPAGSVVGHIGIGNAGVFTIAPPNASPDDARICLDIHGGGLITGGGECAATGIFTATRFGMHTWTVDYRMYRRHLPRTRRRRRLSRAARRAGTSSSGISAGANLAARAHSSRERRGPAVARRGPAPHA